MKLTADRYRETTVILVWSAYSILAGLLLTGCNIHVGPSPLPVTHYVLEIPESGLTGGKSDSRSILIMETAGPALLGSRRLLYRNDELTLKAYRLAEWAEPPTTSFRRLLAEALIDSGVFGSVTLDRLGTNDLILSTTMSEFIHDATEEPGRAMVEVRAQLRDFGTGELIGEHTFQASETLSEYSARGAVEALRKATADVIGETVSWLASFNSQPDHDHAPYK